MTNEIFHRINNLKDTITREQTDFAIYFLIQDYECLKKSYEIEAAFLKDENKAEYEKSQKKIKKLNEILKALNSIKTLDFLEEF